VSPSDRSPGQPDRGGRGDGRLLELCLDWLAVDGHPQRGSVPSGTSVRRMPLAVHAHKTWEPGTTLRVRFLDKSDPNVLEQVLPIARSWSQHANIGFAGVTDGPADIRITFNTRVRSSLLGTDARAIADQRSPTMHLGGLEGGTHDEVRRTVLHEFGHALGAVHEHQQPASAIPWDRDAVIHAYTGPPNYLTPEQVEAQVLHRYDRESVNHTAFDPKSVMLYPIPSWLTGGRLEVPWNSQLSDGDRNLIAEMYPGSNRAARLALGRSVTGTLIRPGDEHRYEIDIEVAATYVIRQRSGVRLRLVIAASTDPDTPLGEGRTTSGVADLVRIGLDAGCFALSVGGALRHVLGAYEIELVREDGNGSRDFGPPAAPAHVAGTTLLHASQEREGERVVGDSTGDHEDRGANRAAELAEADHRAALAELARKEEEARRAADEARRIRENAAVAAKREREKAETDHDRAIAEAQAATVKALLPVGSTLAPVEGTVSVDEKAGILSEIASYALLERAAKNVASSIVTAVGATDGAVSAHVLVTTDRDLTSSDWHYHAVKQPIDRLTAELEDVHQRVARLPTTSGDDEPGESARSEELRLLPLPVPQVAAAALGGLPSILGAAADAAGYFQSNYTVSGRDFDLKADPLVAAMAGALAGEGATVVIDGFHTLAATGLMRAYEAMIKLRWQVASDIVALKQQLDAAGGEVRKPAPARPASHDGVEQLAALASELGARVDGFIAAVTAPEAEGMPPLGRAAVHAALHDREPALSHVLYVSVTASGGETQVRERRFRAPVVRYVGACTISAVFAEADGGRIVHACSKSLMGQLTYEIKQGELGRLQEVSLSG
jgi:hypothetical protein